MILRAYFWICVLLVSAETLYGYYWAIPNAGIRLGLWPDGMNTFLRALIPTLSFWQELAFFSHVVLNTMALIALFYRWSACIVFFTLAFLLDRFDWIVLGLNPVSFAHSATETGLQAFISQLGGIGLMAIIQLAAITLMALMLQNGGLSKGRPAFLRR